MRRSDRIALITKTLSENPNKVISLNHFSKRLGAAKSSISEDMDIIKNALINSGRGTCNYSRSCRWGALSQSKVHANIKVFTSPA